MKKWIAISMLLLTAPSVAEVCNSRFVNPATDICWKCIFPISIGQVPISAWGMDDYGPDNPAAPVCVCPKAGPPWVRVGVAVGFWEPARMVDVTKAPYCMVSLGMSLSGIDGGVVPAGTNDSDPNTNESTSFYQLHYYIAPIMYLLDMIIDDVCQEMSGFDVAYMTEFDPMWNDDELSAIMTPESVLFANVPAQTACAADCVAATAGFPLNPLFWCAGCQGSLYPYTGNVDAHTGGIQASLLLAERMTAKLHRSLLAWNTSGQEAVCSPIPAPIIKKTQYKFQVTYPIPRTTAPLCCNPFGRTETITDPGQEYPVGGEDFGWQVWRKRTCCISY
jgi:conjugal transfer pilus assembly protein TraU